ncbi:MAG: AraC family transcriptional regulator [Bacteroidetes bacterium 43-16]|nr:MAG: AraC family transcriptional regulator [Bacteroidetes bacterium 43-16]
MEQQQIEGFYVTGIAVRTNNISGAAAKDIPALWQRFFEEQVSDKIPGKLSEAIYCVYTDYAGDYTQDYTTLLGCRTSFPEPVPEGMSSKEVAPGKYTCFEAKGKMEEGFVFRQWTEIWQSDLDRAYTSDFEVYEPGKEDNEPMIVPIFIALT